MRLPFEENHLLKWLRAEDLKVLACSVFAKLHEWNLSPIVHLLYTRQQIQSVVYLVKTVIWRVTAGGVVDWISKILKYFRIWMPDIKYWAIIRLYGGLNVCMSCWPLWILKLEWKNIAIKKIMNLDASFHKCDQIAGEKVRWDIVVLVINNMVKNHSDCSDLVAFQSSVYSVCNYITLLRLLTFGANQGQLLIIIKYRIIFSKIFFILCLKKLLYCVIVKC